jgi:hypothetical protein
MAAAPRALPCPPPSFPHFAVSLFPVPSLTAFLHLPASPAAAARFKEALRRRGDDRELYHIGIYLVPAPC